MKSGLDEMILRPVASSQGWAASRWMQRDSQRLMVAWVALFTVKKWSGGGCWEIGKEGWEAGGHTQPS